MEIIVRVLNNKVFLGMYQLHCDKTYYWRKVWLEYEDCRTLNVFNDISRWGKWGSLRVEFKESDL